MLNKDIVRTEMLQDAENSQEMWENIFRNKEWGKYPPESVIRFIARNFYHKNRDEIHILELGIGTGANLWFCAREGFKVSGCEFSQSGVDRFIQLYFFKQKFSNLECDFYIGGLVFHQTIFENFCKGYQNDKFLKYRT